MERIGGFKAEPLAGRRAAALIALTLKQLDGDYGELLREYAPVLLVTVKVPEVKVARIEGHDFSYQITPRKIKVVGLPQVLLESR